MIEFHVVQNGETLLGCKNCKSIKLTTFENVDEIHDQQQEKEVCTLTGLTYNKIFSKYESSFEGLGCILEPYEIKIDPSVTPVIHPPRQIPAALQE